MTKALKVAQIGTANFGAARRNYMRETGLFDLVATYDLNPKAMAQAKDQDGAEPTSSFQELLETEGIEALIVSTGAKYHAEQAIAAMERGLHVFVEKPLCSTPEEMHALLRAQEKSGVVVGVGHSDHATQEYSRAIKEIVESGEMGTIVSIEATTAHSGGLVIKEGEWRGDPNANPGGMLFQCGVHKLHEMMFYLGSIVSVSAMMRYDANPVTGTADSALCNLKFESGVMGSVNAYHITPYRHTMSIYGTAMNLYLDDRAAEGKKLLKQHVAPGFDNSIEEQIAVDLPSHVDQTGGLRNFYHAIQDGGQPSPSLQDGARAVAVVFAAEESAKTGMVQDVSLEA